MLIRYPTHGYRILFPHCKISNISPFLQIKTRQCKRW